MRDSTFWVVNQCPHQATALFGCSVICSRLRFHWFTLPPDCPVDSLPLDLATGRVEEEDLMKHTVALVVPSLTHPTLTMTCDSHQLSFASPPCLSATATVSSSSVAATEILLSAQHLSPNRFPWSPPKGQYLAHIH